LHEASGPIEEAGTDQVLIRSSAMVMEVRAAAEGGGASTGGDSTPYGTASSGFGGEWVGAISVVTEQAVVVVVEKVEMAKVDVGLVVEGEGQGWKTAELLQSGT
jgi:hypothetical protein